MIRVDVGNELHELLVRAEQLGEQARLDISVPFFDADSQLWRTMIVAAGTGSQVRLLTRPATSALVARHFGDLADVGVRTVFLPRIHAKAVLLSDRRGRRSMGWIGSHNFTKASETTAQELGIVFGGIGVVESQLFQQALLQLDAWDRQSMKRTA